MDLPGKIRTLPTSPGVYLYKNAQGEVIYLGKAKRLGFTSTSPERPGWKTTNRGSQRVRRVSRCGVWWSS